MRMTLVCLLLIAAGCCSCSALATESNAIFTDGITMGEDVKGKAAAVRWFDSYFSRYSFASHDVIAAAADEGSRSSFSFYMDQVPLPGSCIPPLCWGTHHLGQAAGLMPQIHITCMG